jgi:hypothetical protein
MSIKNFKFVSPGIFINEIDKSFRASAPTIIGPVIIGRSEKGLAMTPTRVENYQDFVSLFGDTVPGKGGGDVYRNGNNQSPMYGTYAARAFLDAKVAPVTYVRLLGQQSINKTNAGRAGWQTSANPTAGAGGVAHGGGGAYGLFVAQSSSITLDLESDARKSSETGSFHLAAIIYSDGGTPLLNGTLHGQSGKLADGTIATKTTASLGAFVDSDTSGQFKIKFLRKGGAAASTVLTFGSGVPSNGPLAITFGSLGTYTLTFDNTAGSSDATIGTDKAATIDPSVETDSAGNAAKVLVLLRDGVTGDPLKDAYDFAYDGSSAGAETVTITAKSFGSTHDITVTESLSNLASATTAGSGDNAEETQISFDDGSGNFIRKRMNTNPTLIESGTFYPASAEKNYWLGESYEQYLRDNLSSVTTQMVGIMLPLGSGSTAPTVGPSKMKGIGSQEGKAGWFCAQDFGPADVFQPYGTQKLFRLKGRGHGEWLHKNAKVTIERIRGPVSLEQEYGSFSVVLRALADTDANPQVLERFDNINLDPTSPNFISKIIGDTYYKWDEINTRLRQYGDYENQSKYVYVELNDDVAAGASNPACVPFGYYGPPKWADIQISSSNTAANCWQAARTEGIVIGACAANIFGGVDAALRALTGGVDGNMLATLKFPSAPLVANATDAGLTDPTRVNFGMRTTRTATSNSPALGLGDMHRMCDANQSDDPSGLGAPLANGGYHGYGYIMTLDDVVSGSTTPSDKFFYLSGSRNSGASLTATASNDYRTLLDFGYDSFTAPFFGGFDGFDITKPDPLFNKGMDSDDTVKSSYIYHTYKQALEMISDPELLDFNILAVPGLTNEGLTNYQMQLCEDRRDAMAIIDLPDIYTPFSEDYVDATARANRNVKGTVTALRNRRIDTSYACTFYPWVQTRDANSGQSLWVPPSVAMMGVLASSQAAADVWFAPAGFNRGGLSDGAAGIPITNVASRLSSKERDLLYDGKINPIASFPSSGIVVFGQKTLQMKPSALDRINVRRLVIFMKKQISVLSTQVLFEQNVQATWDRFKGLVEPFLANVKTRYGISEYKLVLDETTTTPDLIDQNILYAKIMIKPARAIEFIAIDFIIANTGASFDD